ncbi:hypothetical protein HIM_05377 [Hirsutella minnesotensis 3608]|uniref:Bifunctional lycopene cyclase/phytoene synthase n=1 Tax=Hirsutella minnesotensis 3608 TaxID=1043627 RepID=A0A0F7ZUN7_9HYPO|nr:hypothetical protein HIM_05377 [Hirsutella minnesotensis 3608]
MGYDYALVHVKYTIPAAVALTCLHRVVLTRLDVYRIFALITIALVSTIPWDSYLVRQRIWSYPPDVIIGPTLFSIPAEEIFFIAIQTYNTCLIYLILGRATFYPAYLSCPVGVSGRQCERAIGLCKWTIGLAIACATAAGAQMIAVGGSGTYLGLILAWTGPFLLLLWALSGRFMQRLPLRSTLLPIAIPTAYLWAVDTLALKRGTWVIETRTKLGLYLWDGLEVEEAAFFLATNTLIVFGMAAFDNSLAILDSFPAIFNNLPPLPSPALLVRALLVNPSQYDEGRIRAFQDARARLRRQSRSFYLASAFFHGRLRIDLILLYSFCRVADDLVDDAPTPQEAMHNVAKLREFLDLAYGSSERTEKHIWRSKKALVEALFPSETHSALLYFPTKSLPAEPLFDLLRGFETDLEFDAKGTEIDSWPILDRTALHIYAARVAGTVADLCVGLVLDHAAGHVSQQLRQDLIGAGRRMGIALQLVNIARDIAVDCGLRRVYIPTTWLKEVNLTHTMVLSHPNCKAVLSLRERLLHEADCMYSGSRDAIEQLPPEARAPMRVAVESYMEIGRVLREKGHPENSWLPTRQCLRRDKYDSAKGSMTKTSGRKTAIVVGAGVGGVASAARLAKAGFDVTVLEKNGFTGGRCSLIHHEGYRFDQGPSLLLLPHLFAEAFHDLDTSLEAEGVELLKCEPNYKLWFSDGERFDLSTDLARMKSEIERWEGKDGFERYLDFLQEAHRHYELSVAHVLRQNFTSLLSMVRPGFLRHLLDLHPFESIYRRASRYFRSERLRRVFTFGSMYMGMSPFDAPGTYSLLQYTELAEGIWYPRGGFHRIVEALVGVGKRLGVNYRLSTPVARVTVAPGSRHANGVILGSGEHLAADVVVINADLVYAAHNLLPPSPRAARLATRPASCSSISFYWAMSRPVPELEAHNIFLADAYRESFDDIFTRQRLPSEPSFYVNVPSRIDASAAPAGTDALVVLVPVGHLVDHGDGVGLSNSHDWDAMVDFARETAIATIEARTGARGLREAIVKELVNTPQTWKNLFNLDKGAILGLSHSFFNVLSFRPSTKCPDMERCYFVGASTHPGTGVPICLAGSKITTEQVLRDFGWTIPWPARRSEIHGRTSKRLDVLQRRGLLYSEQMVYLVCAMLLLLLAWQLGFRFPS